MYTRPLLALLCACTSVALTTGAHAGPSEGRAAGAAHYLGANGFDQQLSFNASGSATEGKGQMHFKSEGGVAFTATVDCYRQSGNTAVFTGHTEHETPQRFIRVAVQDNGEPGTQDLISLVQRREPQGPFECEAPQVPVRDLVAGNVQVFER